ncbi:MAG TPA: RDD family protein [Intrasporangium sp.]|uniref:RDD family protein n=1 Tax=Intrasporangium sp. TaxID=1925024 RepID=UPI002B478AAD|nr:RDD family protein [Intrasporangium sp.]HKX65759.1 RDD family protein [Intrasporangium sp.]
MSQQPSGWYDDPSNPDLLRYWDGVTWTSHTAPRKSPTASQSTISQPQQQPPTAPLPQGGAWQVPSGGQQGRESQPYQQHPEHQSQQYQQHPGYPGAGQYPGAPQAQQWAQGPVTADGVPLASWGKRVVAYLLDGIILSVILAFLTPIFVPEFADVVDEFSTGIEAGDQAAINDFASSIAGVSIKMGLLSWLVASVYAIAFWVTLAQTPGKMALRISVRHADRPGPIDLPTAIKRRVIPLVGTFIGLLNLVDLLWPLWDGRRQALHDKVANTLVTQGKQPRRPM